MTDVVCSGRCRVSLKPLLNDLPLVGAVQVFFPPSFSQPSVPNPFCSLIFATWTLRIYLR